MASCGPSNALQNLSKHASADRSLQQDRIGPGAAQRNQFRSQAQGGQLNNEFQQFAQAGPAQSSFENNAYGQLGQFGAHPQMHGAHPQAAAPIAQGHQGDWAHSFSQLNLGPQTAPQNVHHQQQSNWGQDFMKSGHAPQMNHMQAPMMGMNSFGPMYSNSQLYNSTYGLQVEHQQQHKTETKSAQDAAFEAAFGAMEQAIAKPAVDKGKEVDPNGLDQVEALNRQAEHISDNIPQEQVKPNTDDSAEFASIARQIASSLEEADKSKFEKSSFMNLMRRIGNHEVTLDGDKLVNKDGEDIRKEVEQQVEREIQQEGTSQENGSQSEAQRNYPAPFSVHHEPPRSEQVSEQQQQVPEKKKLEDPMEFIEQEAARRAAESGRSVEEEKLNFYSPFEYAQRLGPQGVAKQSSWEEDYDF